MVEPAQDFHAYDKLYQFLKEHFPNEFRAGESIADTVIRLLQEKPLVSVTEDISGYKKYLEEKEKRMDEENEQLHDTIHYLKKALKVVL